MLWKFPSFFVGSIFTNTQNILNVVSCSFLASCLVTAKNTFYTVIP